MISLRQGLLCASLFMFLSGCSTVGDMFEEDKPRLEGERISILELQKNLEPDSASLEGQGFIAPTAWRNEFWPQAGGYPNHTMQNLILSDGALKQIWSSKIGNGSSKKLPLTAQPIVVDGKIFTLDTDSNLTAFSIKNGAKIWRIDVRDKEEDDPVIGGGIAYSQGMLYVTNGYDELLTIIPQTGEIKHRMDLPAPSRAAPTVVENRIFVSTLDNRIFAIDSKNYEILWDYSGIAESAGLVGAASPAASREVVVPAFSSGEIYALRIENGSVAWSENLSSFRTAQGLAGISDIRGLPVIDKGLVIAISFGGRIMAVDERTGTRIWQREIGGSETPWVAGNHLFIISNNSEIVALGRDNGVIRWVTQLPRYKDPEDHEGAIYWAGPVLAGGRLITASTDGRIAEIDPQDGKLLREWSAGKAVRISPVVASSTLFLLHEDGTLAAYQ